MADPPARIVLITRPEPGAQETAARVAAMGARPVVAPLLRIETRALRLPAALPAAVLVTSGNAIPALPECLRAVPLFAVGAATARRAREAGFRQVESADGDACALAALVRDRFGHDAMPGAGGPREDAREPDRDTGLPSAPLLLASGARQGEPLGRALREAGFRVIRRVAYAASPATVLPEAAAALLREGLPHAALFFSAETAHAFVRLVTRAGLGAALRASEAVAIGAKAGVALEALPWRRIRIAARPTQDEMLALLR